LQKRFEWRRSPNRTKKILSRYISLIQKYQSIDNKVLLELGCGKVNSLSLATAFLINGCRKVYAIETSSAYDKTDFKHEAIASGLYEMILDCYAFKNEWLLNKNETYYNNILNTINMEALSRGDWEKAINGLDIILDDCGIDGLAVQKGSIDIMVSWAVFEHIHNFESTIHDIYNIMNNDGILVHVVDFRDHRAIFYNKYNEWSFLCENDTYKDEMCNRLRVNEMKEIFDEVGFDVLEIIRKSKKIPENIYNKLDPHYKKMTKEDIETIQCDFIIRKP
jgi:SAM-dependent methyltransferase